MMPGMDGIETYEIMKEDPENLNKDTPVIMLTANAIVGMEEKYLSHGFAGYITKPIDVLKLEGILKKYITEDSLKSRESVNKMQNAIEDASLTGKIDGNNAAEAENTEKYKAENKIVKNEILNERRQRGKIVECIVNVEAGITNCGGSKEFYAEVIDAFEEEGKKEELIKAYNEKDWELYTINAHSLKGTMRLLGAETAGDMGEKLQFAGEKKDIDTINSFHEEFIDLINASIEKIKSEVM